MAPLLIVTVVNIFSVPLFYRSLGAEMYALWFYVLTFSGSFGFMDLGLGVAVGRYIGVALGEGDADAVRGYWATGNAVAIPLLSAMALVFIVLGVFFGPRWFNVAPDKVALLQWSFVAGGVSLFLSYYGQFWNILSQAHLDFKFLSIVRIVISLLQVLPAILLAYTTHNPLVLISWSAFTTGIQLIIYIWHARRDYSLGFHFGQARWSYAREMSAYTTKTFITLLVNGLLGGVDRLVLGKLAVPADFAHYTISTNAGGRIQGLSIAIMGPIFHNTSRTLGGATKRTPADVFNEGFNFMFGWYVLLAVWVVVWNRVILDLWLGHLLGAAVAPLFPPIIIAYCLSAISNISGAQLGPLNRVGTGIFFHIACGLMVIAGVWIGWKFGAVEGVAYGFLASRVVLVAQDIFVIRCIKAGGWLARSTWLHISGQLGVGLFFFAVKQWLPASNYALIFAAGLHGVLVALWLLRGILFKGPQGGNVQTSREATDFSG